MRYTKSKTHAKTASILKPLLPTAIWVLTSFGKPAFYVLAIILITILVISQLVLVGVLYLISLLGYSTRRILSSLLLFITKTPFSEKREFKSLSLSLQKYFANISKKLKQTKTTFPQFSFRLKLPAFSKFKIALPKVSIPKFPKLNFRFKLNFKKPKLSLPKARYLFLFFLSFALLPVLAFWFFILKDLPPPQSLVTRNIDVSTKIYDRNGILLYKIYKNENRTIIPLAEIPPQVRLATLAAEDAEFYSHPGFSIRGIFRAMLRDIKKGELSGGSTITQQLVKNALLTPEKTITRKLKEIALAIRVELAFSKDEILEMYMNEVSYGGTAYGIKEAADAYFRKNVNDLTIAEAAYLAGLPKSPSKFSPFSGSFEAGVARQKDILNLMKVNKFISEEEEKRALSQKLVFSPDKTDIKAPHFVMYIRSLLAEKYGEEMVEKGGLEVITTLDYGIQKLAEDVVKKEVDNLKKLLVGNGSAVILDPENGEILAMVGSKDYFDTANDGNVNVPLQERQPGSSIKVVNYAYALSNNYTPSSMIDDSPVTYKIPGQPPYSPKNYDGTFRGKVSLRNALAQSLNIPAVKILNSYGVKNMIDLGRKMGITTWNDESRYGLSLTLGGGEVKLLELANVYATIANYGKKQDTMAIKKVTNYKGKILEEGSCTSKADGGEKRWTDVISVNAGEAVTSPCNQTQVLDPRVSYMLIDILKDNNARAGTFGRNSQLVIPKHPEVAVKTGTSNDLKDNYTIGMTRDYVVAVWVGNNDSSPMSRIASGLTGASTIFNKIMTPLLSEKVSYSWDIPGGLVQSPVCVFTGTLPCEGCPTRMEWFKEEKRPTLACRSEQIIAFSKEEEEKRREREFREGKILEPAFSTEAF